MPEESRKRIQRTTFTFWLMLLYIIAALAWWFISLENQNKSIAQRQSELLETKKLSLSATEYKEQADRIDNERKRNTGKYLAEGITFLLLILTGAVIVYRSVRRQFRLQQQQQNFMMAVTHELKTPIAVTRLNLETMLKYNLDAEKQKKLIRSSLDEATRLNFLTNNILISSQLEGGRYHISTDELDLSRLLQDCIRDFRSRFPDRNIVDEIEEEADIDGDALLLQMLINNLLENAIKYSPKEGIIKASLKKSPHIIQLEITDEGPGIPEQEKRKIFDKFYRIGNESTRKTQGTGLGLYLCRKIAQDHNADISMTNHLPHGSNFAVTFHL